MSADNPLATYTIGELWEELASRFDSALLCTNRKHKTDSGSDLTGTYWVGGKVVALGLATMAKARLEKSVVDSVEEESD